VVDENVTEQDPLESVQLVVVPKVPMLAVHVTPPVGVLDVPGDESTTVAVQLLVWLMVIEDGVQFTVVVVVLLATVTVVLPELIACVVSPA